MQRSFRTIPIGVATLVLASLACLSIDGTASGAAVSTANSSIVRTARGTLEYRKVATGQVTGSEQWSLAVHPDGSRTLNTTNRIDAAGLQRNVVLSVDRDFRPRSLFAAFWLGGAWVGTALLTADGERLFAVASTPHGRFTQEVTVPARFAFIPHPPSSNAWQVGAYDRTRGGVQQIPMYDLQTRLPGPGNMFGALRATPVEFLGATRIETPAGRFEVGEEYLLTSLATGR